MHEVLSGRKKDLAAEYEQGFVGMTDKPVPMPDLISAQDAMIESLIGGMPERYKRFLIGSERGQPNWSLLDIGHASSLPAVLWRQQNLDGLPADKRRGLVEHLQKTLAAGTDDDE